MRMRHLFAVAVLLHAAAAWSQVGRNQGLLDPNVADAAAIAALPGADQALADAVVAGRPYLTASQLDEALAGHLNEAQREATYRGLFRQIDLNAASREELMLIPGMSERMAHEFEEYRPYTTLEQFRREIGKYVDDAEVARLEQYVFVPIDLNSAPEEVIMTIPGMTGRMAHEFEEYRPYASLEQFRREIGKYVDQDEVARLESYVTIR